MALSQDDLDFINGTSSTSKGAQKPSQKAPKSSLSTDDLDFIYNAPAAPPQVAQANPQVQSQPQVQKPWTPKKAENIGDVFNNLVGSAGSSIQQGIQAIPEVATQLPGQIAGAVQKEWDQSGKEGVLEGIGNSATAFGGGLVTGLQHLGQGIINTPGAIINAGAGQEVVPMYEGWSTPETEKITGQISQQMENHPVFKTVGELAPYAIVPEAGVAESPLLGAASKLPGLGRVAEGIGAADKVLDTVNPRLRAATEQGALGGAIGGLGGEDGPSLAGAIPGAALGAGLGGLLHSGKPMYEAKVQGGIVTPDGVVKPVPAESGIVMPEQTQQLKLGLTPEEQATQLKLDTRIESPVLDAQGKPILREPTGQLGGEPLELPPAQQQLQLDTPEVVAKQQSIFDLDPVAPEKAQTITAKINDVLDRFKSNKNTTPAEIINMTREASETGMLKTIEEKLKTFSQKELDELGAEIGC